MSVNLHPHYGDTLENLDFWGPLDTLPYSLDDPLWPSRAALEIKGSSLSPGKGQIWFRRGVPLTAFSVSTSSGQFITHVGRWPGVTVSPSSGWGGLNGRLKGYGWTRIPPPVHAPWRSRQV